MPVKRMQPVYKTDVFDIQSSRLRGRAAGTGGPLQVLPPLQPSVLTDGDANSHRKDIGCPLLTRRNLLAGSSPSIGYAPGSPPCSNQGSSILTTRRAPRFRGAFSMP